MNIIGIYGGFNWDANKSCDAYDESTWVHNSGATLFIDDTHICSILEERLSQIKYDGNFPINSIKYCLSVGNICERDIDIVVVPSMIIRIFYFQYKEGIIEKKIKALFPNAKLKIISHHLAHALSSIYSSEFDHGTVITFDGGGSTLFNADYTAQYHSENSTIGYFNKSKNTIKLFNGIFDTNNFGSYYTESAYDVYCTKQKCNYNDSQLFDLIRESVSGKIMGLSAYGSYIDTIPIHYSLSKNMLYEEMPYIVFDEMLKIKQIALRNAEERAYIIQKNFEYAMIDYLTALEENGYIEDNICFAGGSFLNVLTNSLIKEKFHNIHIPPFTSDTGLCFGAAIFGVIKYNKKIPKLPHNISLLGKKYTTNEIQQTLIDFNMKYQKIDNFANLCKETATFIKNDKIIGWFQNKSEFGPRALGSRSILMSPSKKENKDILNSRVKHREYWRPFAGIILEEYLNEYFEESFASPYMLYSLTVKPEKREEIAGITHIDNTCRIQTVNESYHPEITELLQHVKAVTGTPIVLNTSFNDSGNPIIETPADAIRAFNKMDLDYLIIDNFIIEKNNINTGLQYS